MIHLFTIIKALLKKPTKPKIQIVHLIVIQDSSKIQIDSLNLVYLQLHNRDI